MSLNMFYVLCFVILQFITQNECSNWSFSSSQDYCIEEREIFLVRSDLTEEHVQWLLKDIIVDPKSGMVDPCLVLYIFNFETLTFVPFTIDDTISEYSKHKNII